MLGHPCGHLHLIVREVPFFNVKKVKRTIPKLSRLPFITKMMLIKKRILT